MFSFLQRSLQISRSRAIRALWSLLRLRLRLSYTMFIHNFSLWFRFKFALKTFFSSFSWYSVRESGEESTQRNKKRRKYKKLKFKVSLESEAQFKHRTGQSPLHRYCADSEIFWSNSSLFCQQQIRICIQFWLHYVSTLVIAQDLTFIALYEFTSQPSN